MSISALAVAIATCAFAFLMYRRIAQRLDGLSMAHLTLSRTLQHMVSASMSTQPIQQTETGINDSMNEIDDNQQKSIVINDNLGVRRIPVSDDDQSSSASNDDSDSDEDDDGTSNDTDEDNDSEMSQEDTPKLKNLNIMESLDDDNDEDDHLLTLELVASDGDAEEHSNDARVVELNSQEDDEQEEENDDSESDSDDEELDEMDDVEEANSSETQNEDEDVKDRSLTMSGEINAEEIDDIVAFSNPGQNHYNTDLKQQKVETLRKMALEKHLADEESIKKMKKPQLVNILNSQ